MRGEREGRKEGGRGRTDARTYLPCKERKEKREGGRQGGKEERKGKQELTFHEADYSHAKRDGPNRDVFTRVHRLLPR